MNNFGYQWDGQWQKPDAGLKKLTCTTRSNLIDFLDMGIGFSLRLCPVGNTSVQTPSSFGVFDSWTNQYEQKWATRSGKDDETC